MNVIPAINCGDEECVKKHLEMLQDIPATWVHFDVSDGKFTPIKTWDASEELNSKFQIPNSKLSLEVHLMVEEPEEYISRWVKAGAKRILVHVELFNAGRSDLQSRFARFLHDFNIGEVGLPGGCELGLALNPETLVQIVFPYLDRIRFVQFLAVAPGFSGQKFQENVLEKIRTLRARDPHVIIEADGGITLNVAKCVKGAGANVLVSSSYIWNSPNPKEAFRALQEI